MKPVGDQVRMSPGIGSDGSGGQERSLEWRYGSGRHKQPDSG